MFSFNIDDSKVETKCNYRPVLLIYTNAVLVVTGDKDRLVPVRNSRRVSEAIPGSTFEVMKECGHLPHEERAEEFLSIVTRFIKIATLASPKDH